MSPAAKSSPILPRPNWVRGTGHVLVRGDGELVVEVSGPGQISLHLRGDVQFAFEGDAVRRVPSPDRIVFASATGTLTMHGAGIEVEVSGATVVAGLTGRFEVTLDGRGEVETAAGVRSGWGLRPKTLSIDGAKCRDVSPRGGMAA